MSNQHRISNELRIEVRDAYVEIGDALADVIRAAPRDKREQLENALLRLITEHPNSHRIMVYGPNKLNRMFRMIEETTLGKVIRS